MAYLLIKKQVAFSIILLPNDYREQIDSAAVYPEIQTQLKKLPYKQYANNWENCVLRFDSLPRSEMSEVYQQSLSPFSSLASFFFQ